MVFTSDLKFTAAAYGLLGAAPSCVFCNCLSDNMHFCVLSINRTLKFLKLGANKTSSILKKRFIMQPAFGILVANIVPPSLHVVHEIGIKFLRLAEKEADYIQNQLVFVLYIRLWKESWNDDYSFVTAFFLNFIQLNMSQIDIYIIYEIK